MRGVFLKAARRARNTLCRKGLRITPAPERRGELAAGLQSRYPGAMRRRVWILAGLAALTAAGAAARPFDIVRSGPDAWTVVDPQGVEGDGAIRKAWVVRVQRNILGGDPPEPGYLRTLGEYDCGAGQARWREVFVFSRSGQQLAHTVNAAQDWKPAREDVETYGAYRIVCAAGDGDSVVAADSMARVVVALMASWNPSPMPAAPDAKAGPPNPGPSRAKPALKPAPPRTRR